MRSIHLVVVVLLAATMPSRAVVVREGVPDAGYLVADSAFPALVDLPGEGHGVLIGPQWVVTAAHATQGYMLDRVMINGQWREVAELIVHPGFAKPQVDRMAGDAAPLMAQFEANSDIALIRLAKPVEDVAPVVLYRGSDEQGERVMLYGKGATGNGAVGQYPKSSHRGPLRRAYNRIANAHAQWLDYDFDCGPTALPLEGVMGDGDSGGPVMIEIDGQWELAGLADWKHWKGDLANFRAGVCGQAFSNSRISYYVRWIDSVIAGHRS